MNINEKKKKSEIEDAITDMINEGSEGVTTLSKDVEAKYESRADKVPGDDSKE
ncbi:hypothetical protein JK636_11630 [Clostridium sp. YIM B02515]|uniref:Uncharacterized protein n=1 Tax=Clostridium rhizosphaerae TaxID=2803861 RepID=A0ABS1TCQ2_9CLOT|nr:hypothetical protein [Clostridium rhizosphaerae]MBL4936411.1 hypothetical protein [Clostridium rhizosphaerae]